MSGNNDVIIRFTQVSFEYGHQKPILNAVDLSVRRGAKLTLMGQNGAGKTTLFGLIMGALSPEEGSIAITKGLTIATARQVIPRDQLSLTIREFFETAFTKKVYDIDPRIDKVLEVVNLAADHDRQIKTFSGGQQARLLLAHALIQNPDILLLDEPTNNLDTAGIEHLTKFLIEHKKTVIVISHDANFLNSFTEGILYLDIYTKKIEQYMGNYFILVEEIKRRVERERMKNVRLERDIENRKKQAGFFAQKGGHMRDVAKKMKERISELEEEIVEVRQEDKTIRNFVIPCQEEIGGALLEIRSVSILKNHKPVKKKTNITLKKGERLLLSGPNGIGKTTFLEKLASGGAEGSTITEGVRVSFYRQDFSTLDFNISVYQTLAEAMREGTEENLRSSAAGFLIDAQILKTKVGALSEGQKGLVMFAKIMFERPGILILDEPTNHMNFRHIPVIAKALDRYEGAMILVSHVPDFVSQIKFQHFLDLGAL